MAAPHPDAEFIRARASKLAAAYNNRDVDTALTIFADDGLEYSDYGTDFSPPLSIPATIQLPY
jgi:hypothetical protein